MKNLIDIYTEYNIDKSKLSRDYLIFPLKKILNKNHHIEHEKISKEDFIYLYIECNLPRKVLTQYLNVSRNYITRLGKSYNIKKPYKQRTNNIKKSFLDKYGVENISQTKECQEKVKQTNLKKFGVESYTQSDEFKEKSKQTCIEKFGVENYSQTTDFKNLFKDKDFVKSTIQKQYETKKKNGSFGKSEEEDKIYDILLTKFKEVKRQYKSNLYPFFCDFYIPEIDLYIEYQGYFTHGFEPYLGTVKQKELVNYWKSQNSFHYHNAIKVWTISDPIKRNTAKQNNLNWIEFFNMKQFIKWFENI